MEDELGVMTFGAAVKKGRGGWYVYLVESGVWPVRRLPGDFGPYASEVEARRAAPAHLAAASAVYADLKTSDMETIA